MLTETTIIDSLEVLDTGTVNVREVTVIKRGDVTIAESFNRFLIDIADPNPDLSKFDDASRAVVAAARTSQRLAAAMQAVTNDAESVDDSA
jgi:hypothetical protein